LRLWGIGGRVANPLRRSTTGKRSPTLPKGCRWSWF